MCHNCKPSDSQVASLDELLRMYEGASDPYKIEASMDEYNVGDMIVVLTIDGAPQSAWFDRNGRIVGNWL